MNNRFDHFIYESGLIAQGCWDKFDDYDKEALEKFGLMIVRDCILEVLKSSHRHDDMAAIVAQNIKKHFGVDQ